MLFLCFIVQISVIFVGYKGGITSEFPDSRECLSKKIHNELNNQEFAGRSKSSPTGVCSRGRKLTINRLILLIMSLQRALQRELDSFFQKLTKRH
jgi:hypothetical protein